MSRRTDRARLTAALLAGVVALAGCASIPSTGPVREGGTQVDTPGRLGFTATGPVLDAEPVSIVDSFVRAAAFGPASATNFTVAQEFLTPVAWSEWDRTSQVLVLEDYPTWSAEEIEAEAVTATVQGQARVIAMLDERGVFTELPEPGVVDVEYDLVRNSAGQWRIDGLADGLVVDTGAFFQSFHYTPLYFPTPDRRWWVPDVRWFPQQTWRTEATRELLGGPPPWLARSATSAFPEGTGLAIRSVAVTGDGIIEVSVTAAIATASPEDRALAVAQLTETLATDADGREVVLMEGATPLTVMESPPSPPARPVTVGDAVAVVGAEAEADAADVDAGADAGEGDEPALRVQRVVGRELTEIDDAVDLTGLDPTAVASGPDSTPIVVRDGGGRIVRVDGPDAPVLLMSGAELAPPSVDRFGAVWTAAGSAVLASDRGEARTLEADWLAGLDVVAVRVAPEGARVALVVEGDNGNEVLVTGVERDAEGAPVGLSVPTRVGAPVDAVTDVAWYAEAQLVLLTPGGDGGLDLAGVGGLQGPGGGLTRDWPGPSGTVSLTAAVGPGGVLALAADGTLQARQSAAFWPTVAEDVIAVAYPG